MSAFVMSHGRNMLIMKIVGYAEDVIHYYKLEDFKAHIWIGHQRYPTKGRVWHPGGAHPFMGLDEALVHNGDFANYYSVTEYLGQKGIKPLFLTDTEVSVLLFDLLNRVYGYPLEYILEALAPTTERDFHLLSEEKQKIYRAIQSTHLQRSPDGPWFFIISRNDYYHDKLQLIGITDTSMLRPQVFALVEGEVQIGLIASEKQAIDSALLSLASGVQVGAAAGGHVLERQGRKPYRRRRVHLHPGEGRPGQGPGADLHQQVRGARHRPRRRSTTGRGRRSCPTRCPGQAGPHWRTGCSPATVEQGYQLWKEAIPCVERQEVIDAISSLSSLVENGDEFEKRIDLLTMALDRRYPTGRLRRAG